MSMALEPRRQLLQLLGALVMGFALGALYDLLRPPRRRIGRLCAALLDLLFALLAGAATFLYAMGALDGRLGLWELTASALGFLLYMPLLSPLFYPLFSACFAFLCRMIGSCKILCAKVPISAKKNFQKVRKCFIVKR